MSHPYITINISTIATNIARQFLLITILVSSTSVHAQIDFPIFDRKHPKIISLFKQKAPPNFRSHINELQTLKIIVKYRESSTLQNQISQSTPLPINSYRATKRRVIESQNANDIVVLRDYTHLPMNVITLKTEKALIQFLKNHEVEKIYYNEKAKYHLNESLPLINQQATLDLAFTGQGTTVAVLDSGVDYTDVAFGSCIEPGLPSSCRVNVAIDIAPDDGFLDHDGHGTNVAAITAGTAPNAKIAALDISDGGSIFFDDIIAGIDWAIANQTTYNIVAINMSIGSSNTYSEPCNSLFFNPFITPVSNARAVGISVLASSGNEADSNGLSMPACTPGIISVGAVYDENLGGLDWGICLDSTTDSLQVACFSNSNNYLTLWAPGALISAAGITLGGTSQAVPHASGAIAILRSAYPNDDISILEQRILQSNTLITDPRNNITKPGLDIFSALGAVNDFFLDPILITNTSRVSNVNASTEVNEPMHAGEPGGSSLWWKWTAPSNNMVCFTTRGSDVDTVLAVYTGSAMTELVEIAANDNANNLASSEVCFSGSIDQEYNIVVDSIGGEKGIIQLNFTGVITNDSDEEIPLPPWALVLLGMAFISRISILYKGHP